jgi:long-chain acyl-CoA synthetase
MADLAIWMAGHVSAPIYPSLKAQSIRQILEHAEAKACFAGETDEKEITTSGLPPGVECICLPNLRGVVGLDSWEGILAATAPLRGKPVRPADNLATIMYTSGTTGMPKGVMHSFAAFSFDAVSLAHRLGLSDARRVLSYLPLAHIVERVGVQFFSVPIGDGGNRSPSGEVSLVKLGRARYWRNDIRNRPETRPSSPS